MSKKLKNDIILVAVMLCVAAAGFLIFTLTAKQGAMAVVTIDGEVVEELSLMRNCEIRYETENGYNIVKIEDGIVTVSEASCPDKICVNHRPISKTGETIACLPNKLVVEIVSEE